MKVVVVGLGYVGLSNALVLAQNCEVVGVDISADCVDLLNRSISPIEDEEFSKFLKNNVLNLRATTDLCNALEDAYYVVVALPTNYDENKNCFDTSAIEDVVQQCLLQVPKACVFIKSTVPVGFIDYLRSKLNSKNIIFSPEFLREGFALNDILHPSRIIVGEHSNRARAFAELLQKGSYSDNVEVLLTGTREAEAIKLFSNSYLAMRVAFFNELDSFALSRQLDSREIINGVSLDTRIGTHYNNPSFGYGGYCLPKDTKQLLADYEIVPQNIISAIVQANTTRKELMAKEILSRKPNTVGVYRLVMKSDSNNFRQAAILEIMKHIKASGVRIVVYEPNLSDHSFLDSPVLQDLKEFINVSDVIIANRMTSELTHEASKVFTRDLFGMD